MDVRVRDNDRTGTADGFVTAGVVGMIMRIDDKPDRFIADFPDGL